VTILGLRRGVLIDKAARVSDGAKEAEVLDHPLTSPGPACGSRAEQVGSFWKEKFA
jgi:hypothetical protein